MLLLYSPPNKAKITYQLAIHLNFTIAAIFETAMRLGQSNLLDVIKNEAPNEWLTIQNQKDLCSVALTSGYLANLQWLDKQMRSSWLTDLIMRKSYLLKAVVLYGELEILQFVKQKLGEEWHKIKESVIKTAILQGPYEIIIWLKQELGDEWDTVRAKEIIVNQAIPLGQLQKIEWFKQELGDEWHKIKHTALYAAIKYGQLEILKWLKQDLGNEWTNMITAYESFVSFNQAFKKRYWETCNFLLQEPDYFAYALDLPQYTELHGFDLIRLIRKLWEKAHGVAESAVFDISKPAQAIDGLYLLRNLLQRNDSKYAYYIPFLISIPAINALARKTAASWPTNELLSLTLNFTLNPSFVIKIEEATEDRSVNDDLAYLTEQFLPQSDASAEYLGKRKKQEKVSNDGEANDKDNKEEAASASGQPRLKRSRDSLFATQPQQKPTDTSNQSNSSSRYVPQ